MELEAERIPYSLETGRDGGSIFNEVGTGQNGPSPGSWWQQWSWLKRLFVEIKHTQMELK